MVLLNSTVTSVTSAASSPLSPSFILIIGSSWPYGMGMTSDMTFASLVPTAAFTLMSASALTTPKPTVRASGSTKRCGASTPPTRVLLPVQHDLTTPRARARAARLRANEAAERREDLAALVTTPVSNQSITILSFVKCRRTQYDTNHFPLLRYLLLLRLYN